MDKKCHGATCYYSAISGKGDHSSLTCYPLYVSLTVPDVPMSYEEWSKTA